MAVIYLCPADKRLSCPWEGSASEIKQHFENEHDQLVCYTNCVEIDLQNLPENKLLYLEDEVYLMQNYIDKSRLVVRLRYLGSNETAAKMQYDITATVNKISYKYDPARYFSCIVPVAGGWEINLECLEKFHGQLQNIKCTVGLNYTSEQQRKISTTKDVERKISIANDVRRKISNTSLKINNQYIEANFIDETEQDILDDLKLLDEKLEVLKQQRGESGDFTEKTVRFLDDKSEDSMQKQGESSEFFEKAHHLNPDDNLEDSIKKQRESGDFMDKISHLNFSILEEPFDKNEELGEYSESLPNIPEEVNLSCSSCGLDMLPPIYLCINGHNVCSWCKSTPCKICQGTVTINRNTDLENISRTHLHQCRYSTEGCVERLLYNEVRAHEARCQFCKYKCMNCVYQGRFGPFHNHLKIVHSSVKLSVSTRTDFPKNTEMYIINKSIGIFFCKSELTNEVFMWRATFCGPSERQFFCELSFKGSKYKEPIFLKRKGNVYEIRKPVAELKKFKAKEKYAVLNITSYE